ncbi:general secretion pathway protein H [Gammaproteobacteria bacterium]
MTAAILPPAPRPAYRRIPGTGGFTLLEILAVMVIIGVLATMAVLSVGSREPATSLEARRLAELLRLAATEAVLQGQEWGLRLRDDGYEFMILQETTWQTANDEILHARQFPHELEPRLSLESEELRVELPPTAEDNSREDRHKSTNKGSKDKKEAITPQIFILSSGEVSPFQITLYAEKQPAWRVIGGIEGNFTVLPLQQR